MSEPVFLYWPSVFSVFSVVDKSAMRVRRPFFNHREHREHREQFNSGIQFRVGKRALMSPDIATLRGILKSSRPIAVVGLSADWNRPSNFAAKYMQQHGYRIIPVNPRYPEVLGEKSYARLEDIPEPVDIVDVFRRTEEVLPIARSAIAIGAKCLWQQIGVVNEEADRLAREAGLDSIMDRCVKIEHARLFGGLNWAGVNTRGISAKRPA